MVGRLPRGSHQASRRQQPPVACALRRASHGTRMHAQVTQNTGLVILQSIKKPDCLAHAAAIPPFQTAAHRTALNSSSTGSCMPLWRNTTDKGETCNGSRLEVERPGGRQKGAAAPASGGCLTSHNVRNSVSPTPPQTSGLWQCHATSCTGGQVTQSGHMCCIIPAASKMPRKAVKRRCDLIHS
jgi:hypothetical protein